MKKIRPKWGKPKLIVLVRSTQEVVLGTCKGYGGIKGGYDNRNQGCMYFQGPGICGQCLGTIPAS